MGHGERPRGMVGHHPLFFTNRSPQPVPAAWSGLPARARGFHAPPARAPQRTAPAREPLPREPGNAPRTPTPRAGIASPRRLPGPASHSRRAQPAQRRPPPKNAGEMQRGNHADQGEPRKAAGSAGKPGRGPATALAVIQSRAGNGRAAGPQTCAAPTDSNTPGQARRGGGAGPHWGTASAAAPGPRRHWRRGAGRGPAATQGHQGRQARTRRGLAAARTEAATPPRPPRGGQRDTANGGRQGASCAVRKPPTGGAAGPDKSPLPPHVKSVFFALLSAPWGHQGKKNKPLLPCSQGEGERGARAPAGRGARGGRGRGRRNGTFEGGSGGGYSKSEDPRGSSPMIRTNLQADHITIAHTMCYTASSWRYIARASSPLALLLLSRHSISPHGCSASRWL